MHVMQYLLVEADDRDDAQENVRDALSKNEPTWSGWHNASGVGSFAGRWQNTAFEFEGFNQEGVSLDTLCYKDNPELFERALKNGIQSRQSGISDCREKILTFGYDLVEATHDPYSEESTGLKNWYYRKMSEMLDNVWVSGSGVYDLEVWDAGLAYWKKRVALNPERQFIVAVDFHF